jgi:hypothetical protein
LHDLLEKWNVEVNYGQQSIRVDGKAVKPSRTANGHYVTMLDTEDADDTTYVGSMITDDVFEMDFGIEVHMTDMVDDVVQLVCSRSEHQQRKMRFWEVYVDEGNLSQFLNKKDDVEARIFSLPDWNFENREEQLRFLDLMDQERPLHIMMAFECRLWSPMQNMNYRTDERKKILAEMRAVEEKTHLRFYSEVHKKGKSIGCDVTAEQPAEALSWRTTTLESMRGYFETVLDRCRTALKMNPRDTKLVKKPTRFRSTKRLVTEACNLSCISRGPHQQMMGQGKALKQMRNYEPGLVKILGDAIYNSKEVAWRKRCQAELMMMEMVEKSEGNCTSSSPTWAPISSEAHRGREAARLPQGVCAGDQILQMPNILEQTGAKSRQGCDTLQSPPLQPHDCHRHLLCGVGWPETWGADGAR